MLFNSYAYLFAFLPVAWLVYFGLCRQRLTVLARAWLVLASLFFYGWWDIAYVPLLMGSLIGNYALARTLPGAGGQRRLLLIAGIAANLGLLVYFKYTGFLVDTLNTAGAGLDPVQLVLPLGISFFTFQQIAFLVDAYRDEVRELDFLNYCVFVCFFPQLIAGPIVHHKEMMPQFAARRAKVLQVRNIAAGLFIFALGLFKKVAIADSFAVWARAGFDDATTLSLVEAWATSLSYTFQLYFDFSGYTDMAIGAALLFNIRLPMNFNAPYRARNIQDFWRRWHMTLSRFLRDYVYIPLGGNRLGEFATLRNMFLTFFLGGLWHGAGWGFMIWGALHGLAMVGHRLWTRLCKPLPGWLAWLATFNFVNATWVFFRAETLDDAWKVLGGMLGLNGGWLVSRHLLERAPWLHDLGARAGEWGQNLADTRNLMAFLLLGFALSLTTRGTGRRLATFVPTWRTALLTAILGVLGVMGLTRVSEFLYFNF